MKVCKFPECKFHTTDDCETLDERHIYCLSCGEIVHFNCRFPTKQMGKCVCGRIVEENLRTGKTYSFKLDECGMTIPSSVIYL